MSIKIICDSTAYIPGKLLEKFDITVVSLNILIQDKSYREVDIDQEFFYEKLKTSAELPTSALPNVNEMYEAFEKLVIQGHSVVGVFMSSDMSGTYSSANLVKNMILEKYPKAIIEIVDSRSNSMQLGFVTLAAAQAAKAAEAAIAAEAAVAGESMELVLAAADNVIKKSKFLFVPDTLEYLKKGGRIGGATAILGSILQIRPVLTVLEGKTSIVEKVRTKKNAVNKIVEILKNDLDTKGIEKIIVHNINCEEEGQALSARLKELLGYEVEIYAIGPVIGLHTGPGAIGIVYYTKE